MRDASLCGFVLWSVDCYEFLLFTLPFYAALAYFRQTMRAHRHGIWVGRCGRIYFCVSRTQSVALAGVTHRCLCSQQYFYSISAKWAAGSRQVEFWDEQRPTRPPLSSPGMHKAEKSLKIDLQMCKSLENQIKMFDFDDMKFWAERVVRGMHWDGVCVWNTLLFINELRI